MEFDRIYTEIDLGHIEENMEAMEKNLRPGTKMYGVVKTDAYGHGAVPVAKTIDRFVCGYAVATATGTTIDFNVLDEVCKLAASRGAWRIVDETYLDLADQIGRAHV